MLKECFNFFLTKKKKKSSHRVIGNLKEFTKRHHLMKWAHVRLPLLYLKWKSF